MYATACQQVSEGEKFSRIAGCLASRYWLRASVWKEEGRTQNGKARRKGAETAAFAE